LQNIIRITKSSSIRWVGHVARVGKMRNSYKVLVGKLKRPLGRCRLRWKDDVKMDLQEIVLQDVNWTRLAQDRDQLSAFVNTVMTIIL